MIGKLDPEDRIMTEPTVMEQVASLIQKYGWEDGDEISVEMAGTQVSGIDVGEEYNKKWQSPLGTRKINKDAFIVIKNQTRRDLSTQPRTQSTPCRINFISFLKNLVVHVLL